MLTHGLLEAVWGRNIVLGGLPLFVVIGEVGSSRRGGLAKMVELRRRVGAFGVLGLVGPLLLGGRGRGETACAICTGVSACGGDW